MQTCRGFIQRDLNTIKIWCFLTVLFSAQCLAVFDHEMMEWLRRVERHRQYDSQLYDFDIEWQYLVGALESAHTLVEDLDQPHPKTHLRYGLFA